jgi:tellurite resistance protein TehA-like permease
MILGLSGMLLLFFAEDAYAYLDPGSFSYVIQVIIAVAVGALYALKVYWGKIKAFFSKNNKEENIEESK